MNWDFKECFVGGELERVLSFRFGWLGREMNKCF